MVSFYEARVRVRLSMEDLIRVEEYIRHVGLYHFSVLRFTDESCSVRPALGQEGTKRICCNLAITGKLR